MAANPATDRELLWHIARTRPDLRRWLVANPAADATLLEYVSQAGGPGVRQALEILLRTLVPGQAPDQASGRGRPESGRSEQTE